MTRCPRDSRNAFVLARMPDADPVTTMRATHLGPYRSPT